MEKVDAIVIGAGVIGLAVARALADQGREVLVLESEDAIGTGTSSRNSEVIHAGIYYPSDSYKARLCVKGKEMLYEYLEDRSIDYQRCGKLIVATRDEEADELNAIKAKAEKNGVKDLELLDQNATLEMEPNLNAVASILSPSSGIFDTHGFLLSLQGDLEDAGGQVVFLSPVDGAKLGDDGHVVKVGGEASMEIACDVLVNSAGLGAKKVAERFEGLKKEHIPALYYARGNYFTLTGVKPPFGRLIYPLPEPGGLGIHYTLDMGGQGRFGPDVEWISDVDYEVSDDRRERFVTSIRTYWPEVKEDYLQRGYAGIRPKTIAQGEGEQDFTIHGPEEHGVPGLVNLFGIESPGLTSCLAIGALVADLVKK